jgi:c-di-GMP-binding flagellar brake protein YcgR
MPAQNTAPGRPKKILPQHIRRKDGDALDLAPGERCIVEPEGLGKRFKSLFVGMERNQYLILRITREAQAMGTREYLHMSKPVTVRYLHRGQVCGFSSRVLSAIYNPVPLLFLHYPAQIEVLDVRSEDRMEHFLPCRAIYGGQERHGVILNLSRGGCRLLVERGAQDEALLTKGSEVFCRAQLLDTEHEVYLHGEVRNAQTVQRNMVLGVQFTNQTQQLEQMLMRHLQSTRLLRNG